ncbi:MAG: isocitrate lyase/phosphoenolpyruvate mutase family protein [Candidatus Omnitrophica bacterium]|nr:isocitrate lyase/phosphoenolpyruvate mutase family protein [Candidatus Omnitrophota bacterium]
MARLERDWKENPRWNGIVRTYTPKEVINLRGTFHVEYTLAKRGSERFWNLLHNEPYILALGALTGNQAKEQVRGGLKAIYASGWQIAADANVLGQTLPDLSLYPHNSGPKLVEALNNALQRQDQIEFSEGKEGGIDWQAPIILDMEAGFGGPKQLHVATMEAIKAGASAIHIEDQGDKKCGHMGGKCLVSTGKMVERVQAARLTADIAGVPLVIIGRTDAEQAKFLETTGVPEPVDQALVLGTTPDGKEMTYAEARAQGFAGEWTDKGVGGTWTPKIRSSQHGVKLYEIKPGLEAAIKRALSYAPYVEFLWKETNAIDLEEDQKFAEAIHTKYPGKLLAYNLSPSLNWGLINKETRERYHRALAEMGYRYQFVTLAGFHTLNLSMFELATAFKDRGMAAYYDLVQKPEFEAQVKGYTAVKHQREAGTGYFDKVEEAIGSGTGALEGSTEEAQFNKEAKDGADRRVGLTDRERVVEDTARWKVARTIAKYWDTLNKNPGTLIVSPSSSKPGSFISVRALADPRMATLAIDAALFEQKTTREEFEIILSMLKETLTEAGSEKAIWLIQTNPDASYKPFLEELAKQYNFVQLLSLQAYHEKLDQLKEEELLFGLLRVGYEENKTSMRLTDQDVWVRRPDEKKKEIVSAFSFMSLALLKDPEFASIRSQLGDLLKGIGQALVIRPTPEYLEAVKVIHQQI